MRTAEEMYYFSKNNGFGAGFNEKQGLKHFKVIENNLQPDEDVKFAFIGLHNYKSMTKHDGNFAYAVSNKRILMGQQKLIGVAFQSVSMDNINDITLQTGVLMGNVVIDTVKERFNVNVGKDIAEKINYHLHRVLDEVRNPQPVKSKPAPKSAGSHQAAADLRYYKDLFEEGLITEAEYQAKRKQILGL